MAPPENTILTSEKKELILSLLRGGEDNLLNRSTAAIPPEDLADWLPDLSPVERRRIFLQLPVKTAGDVLDRIAPAVQSEFLKEISPALLGPILETMPVEEAAEVIAENEPELVPDILEVLPRQDSTEIKQILTYPEDSVGRIMDVDLISVDRRMSVEETIREIKSSSIEETLYSVFVTAAENKLVGLVPLRNLLTAPRGSALEDIMMKIRISVKPETDQEEAARLVVKYDLAVLPVVNGRGELVGRVTADDVMEILDEETSEDIYRMAGTDEDELRATSSFTIARIRLPWLLICIGGSFFSALVIRSFEITLARVVSLVAFIPMITATGGNVGLQSSSIVIRGLALGTLKASRLWREVLKQIRVAVLLGVACGIILAAIALIWRGEPFLGAVVGISMFLAVAFSTLSGVLIPLTFYKLHIDPAIASGPLITTLNDVLGIALYLTSATLMIKFLL